MSTVDEILASGWYTDRRGRGWDYVETVTSWCSPEIDAEGASWGYRYLDTAQMRLLIERDMHRDVCEGLMTCTNHPVPHVVAYLRWAGVVQAYPSDSDTSGRGGAVRPTLFEAMDAARALAVKP